MFSNGNISPHSTLHILSYNFNSNPPLASKVESSKVLNDTNLHLVSSLVVESNAFASFPFEGLIFRFSNPFGNPLFSRSSFESLINHHPNSLVNVQFLLLV
jgi:hypothetical protein